MPHCVVVDPVLVNEVVYVDLVLLAIVNNGDSVLMSEALVPLLFSLASVALGGLLVLLAARCPIVFLSHNLSPQ